MANKKKSKKVAPPLTPSQKRRIRQLGDVAKLTHRGVRESTKDARKGRDPAKYKTVKVPNSKRKKEHFPEWVSENTRAWIRHDRDNPEAAPPTTQKANGSRQKIQLARDALQLAFEGIGGVRRLIYWAQHNETEFYKLYAKLIPVSVQGTGEDGTIKIVFIQGDDKL